MFRLLVIHIFMVLTISTSLIITERLYSFIISGLQPTDLIIPLGIGDIIQAITAIGLQCQCSDIKDMCILILTQETDMYIQTTEEFQEQIECIQG